MAQPQFLTDLIQELIAIPSNRWKKKVQEYDQHTIENPNYLESYQIEHREFRISVEGYYGGMNSGIVKLNLFNGHNGRGLPIGSTDTIRKDILLRIPKIPDALSELYAKIQENYKQ